MLKFVFISLCRDDIAESFSSLFLLRVLPDLNIYLPCRLQTAGEMKLLKLETVMLLWFN